VQCITVVVIIIIVIITNQEDRSSPTGVDGLSEAALWFLGTVRKYSTLKWAVITVLWIVFFILATVLCGPLTVKHTSSSDHATSSVTAVLPPPVQHCGTVCRNSFGNRTSPLDNLNNHLKRLSLVSRVAAPCAWTLRALTRNLFIYLLYLLTQHACTVVSVCEKSFGRQRYITGYIS